VIIIGGELYRLLLRKLLPLPLELSLGGLQVHLSGLQACCLLMKVLCVAVGALVRQHDLRGVVGKVVAVDVEALAGRRVVVDAVGVILRAVPREDLEEGA
jgi:hypothetical protein